MTLCSCTPCAGSLTPTGDPCPGSNCATCNTGGCASCAEGLYTFLANIGAAARFNDCLDCQPLNCAPGGCSNDIGGLPNLTICA